MDQIQYITEESSRKISVEENKGEPDQIPEDIAQNRLLIDDYNIDYILITFKKSRFEIRIKSIKITFSSIKNKCLIK